MDPATTASFSSPRSAPLSAAALLLARGALDLTSLNDGDTTRDAEEIARRAVRARVPAVCVWPRLAGAARRAAQLERRALRRRRQLSDQRRRGGRGRGLDKEKDAKRARGLGEDVGDGHGGPDALADDSDDSDDLPLIAGVVNFPAGDAPPAAVERETVAAMEAGCDEMDVVVPWRALLERGDEAAVRDVVRAARRASAGRVLKVILETGALPEALTERAARIAVAEGADFLKTSTGRHERGADPAAVRVLLRVIADSPRPVGLKVSGGVRTAADALAYVRLCEEAGLPASPDRFRIGASSLLDALERELGVDTRAPPPVTVATAAAEQPPSATAAAAKGLSY